MALSTTAANRKDLNTGRSDDVTFQHRHFAKVAAIIAAMDQVPTGTHGFVDVREDVALHFANALAATNRNFNRSRFIAACMVEAN